MRPSARHPDTERVPIDRAGRLVIPARFREALGIRGRQTVVVGLSGDSLRVRTLNSALERLQRIARRKNPDAARAVADFIDDRRAESDSLTDTSGARRKADTAQGRTYLQLADEATPPAPTSRRDGEYGCEVGETAPECGLPNGSHRPVPSALGLPLKLNLLCTERDIHKLEVFIHRIVAMWIKIALGEISCVDDYLAYSRSEIHFVCC